MQAKYSNTISGFLQTEKETIIGHLSLNVPNHQLLMQQRLSWDHQIDLMQACFSGLPAQWGVAMEYAIPRRCKRIDIVLIAQDIVFIIEYKDREKKYTTEAISQVDDYALDIRDFHKQSSSKTIIPIVWASDAPTIKTALQDNGDFVKPALFANRENLQ